MTVVDRTARTAGVLLITATAASLVGSALLGPVLDGSDFLTRVFEHQDRVLWGAFMIVISAFTSAGIAIALYPVLRPYSRGLALGSVGFRVMEASMYLVSALGPLLLVGLSQDVARGDAGRTLGTTLKALRDQAGMLGALAFYIGGGMYYVVLHQSRLIPRWLSDWGLVAVALGFVAGALVVFQVTTFGSPLMVGLNLPIFVQELVMAVWLLVRGFAQGTGARQLRHPDAAGLTRARA